MPIIPATAQTSFVESGPMALKNTSHHPCFVNSRTIDASIPWLTPTISSMLRPLPVAATVPML